MSASKYDSFTQMLMIVWCSLSLALHMQASFTDSLLCLEEERATLLHFKSSFTHHNSSALNSWIPTTDCCRWDGVNCDPSTGHVIELWLDSAILSGQLPTYLNSSTLPMLRRFNLSFNKITGIIPAWLFEFPSLISLNLDDNLFTGFSQAIISPVVSPLEIIKVWSKSNYKLQGSIPTPILEIKSLQSLVLFGNNLTGTIYFSQLYKLRNLTTLFLSYNNLSLVDDMYNNDTAGQLAHHYSWPQFTRLGLSSCNLGQFPTFLRGQSKLEYLGLVNNSLHGEVPEWMLQVGRHTLTYLELSRNSLTGRLDRLLWPNLTYIILGHNMFEGPIPSSLCDLDSMRFVFLSNNKLSGNLPTCLAELFNHGVFYFDISHNQFNGTVPSMIFEQCKILWGLRLDANQFSGEIPKSLEKCSQLELLNLANNQFTDTFPYWFETPPNLKVLNLGSNNIYGPLLMSPNTTSSYSKLQILDLSNNNLSGGLSSKFLMRFSAMINGVTENVGIISFLVSVDRFFTCIKGVQLFLDKIPNNLMYIDISSNRFQGQIPNSIGDLASLKWLNLSHNNFTGHIPSSLAKVSQLESLDLSSNHLNGRIPNDLAKLYFLAAFNVSNNNLVGLVLNTNQFSTFQDGSYQHNPGLCGPFLTTKCDESHDNHSTPLKGEEKAFSSSFALWGFVFIGCSCGVVVGFVAGCFLFIKRTPMFLLRFIVWLENSLKSTKTKRSCN